jgi:hypothetical protein
MDPSARLWRRDINVDDLPVLPFAPAGLHLFHVDPELALGHDRVAGDPFAFDELDDRAADLEICEALKWIFGARRCRRKIAGRWLL